MQILTVSGLQKTYTTRFGGSKVQALKNVNFTVESGEYVAIMGESGSGKTTLLNILAALDKPTGGTVLLGGKNLSEIPEETAAAFRRDNLGFVFQDFSLLDTFSLEDNICLPLVLAGKSRTEMRDRLSPLAYDLGIETLLKKYPYEVSGGQKQRAAVARALITRPRMERAMRSQIMLVSMPDILLAKMLSMSCSCAKIKSMASSKIACRSARTSSADTAPASSGCFCGKPVISSSI